MKDVIKLARSWGKTFVHLKGSERAFAKRRFKRIIDSKALRSGTSHPGEAYL